ncbi:MAG: succinate dehydrogenase/fumarate reductase iron-sulfur subunit, partial [Gemmatimonadaceae bacterium]
TGAKLTHLGMLPQGQPERDKRALAMVEQMDDEGFGYCTLVGECTVACPKEISIDVIKQMNQDFIMATARRREPRQSVGAG